MRDGLKILLIVGIIGVGIISILPISNLGTIPQNDLNQSSELADRVNPSLKVTLVESMEMRNP